LDPAGKIFELKANRTIPIESRINEVGRAYARAGDVVIFMALICAIVVLASFVVAGSPNDP
jgi:hypothetical protein